MEWHDLKMWHENLDIDIYANHLIERIWNLFSVLQYAQFCCSKNTFCKSKFSTQLNNFVHAIDGVVEAHDKNPIRFNCRHNRLFGFE